MTLKDHRLTWQTWGLTLLRGAVDRTVVDRWVERLADYTGQWTRVDADTDDEPVEGHGTHRHYSLLDGDAVRRVLPELFGWYHGIRWWAEDVTERSVIVSPYSRSSVNVKLYSGGDAQDWHYDSNALTALLYLTATDPDTATQFRPFPDVIRHMEAAPGDLLLMKGREVLHRVPSLPDGTFRITCPLNLYYSDDTWHHIAPLPRRS